MKKVEQVFEIVTKAFGSGCETILYNDRALSPTNHHLEFVISSNITKSIIAVFSISSVIYNIKYIDAAYIKELTEIDEELDKIKNC